jgi:hypothetical protein
MPTPTERNKMSLTIFPSNLTINETIITGFHSHELFQNNIVFITVRSAVLPFFLFNLSLSLLQNACTTQHNNFSSLGKGRTLLACSPSSFPARHPATYVTVVVSARNGKLPCLSAGVDSYKRSGISTTTPINTNKKNTSN